MYAQPVSKIEFAVDDLIPAAGLSVLAGKPKAGKSVAARQLACCVAMGSPFLGRQTRKGTVMYLALEEHEAGVREHFELLGLPKDAPMLLHCGGIGHAGQDVIADLQAIINRHGDTSLVIIDTLFCFLRVADANDYAKVNPLVARLRELGRSTGAAVLVIHHQKKRASDDSMDGTLGSTAINGAADTVLMLSVDNGHRVMESRQRYGTGLEPTRLLWDQWSARQLLYQRR